jgi:RNA polymerase sigma-70 factor (ECF subfamily)
MTTQPDIKQYSKAITQTSDWDTVFVELLPKVYRYFCYRVGEGQLAEDLTSTTFEKAWRKRHRYRKDLSAFSTWIFTIAHNVAIDHFRTAHHPLALEDVGPVYADNLSPETRVEQQEHFARLAHTIAQLPEREQELLALKYGSDMSYRDIATVMDLTPSNVGVILHRAIKQLRTYMEADNE